MFMHGCRGSVFIAFRRMCLHSLCRGKGASGGGPHCRPSIVEYCRGYVSFLLSTGGMRRLLLVGSLGCRVLGNSGTNVSFMQIGGGCQIRFAMESSVRRPVIAMYGVVRLSGRCG